MEPTRRRCEAFVIDGHQCKRPAREGENYCGTHIRARRATWLKKVQGGAELAKASAKVISAATSVYMAYKAVAPFWGDFLSALSHYINFFHTLDDKGAHQNQIETKASHLKAYVESMRMASNSQDISDACIGLLNCVQYEHDLATQNSRLNAWEWVKEREKTNPLIGFGFDESDLIGSYSFQGVVGAVLYHTSELEKAFAEYQAAATFVTDHLAATDPQDSE